MGVSARAISIEGDADPVTLSLIRQVLAAAPGKVDLFVQAARPAERPEPVRVVGWGEPQPVPLPPAVRVPGSWLVHELVTRAAMESGLAPAAIVGDFRHARVVRIRDAVVLVARERGASSPVIGRVLGDRDHTTILHADRRARRRLTRDEDFRLLAERMRAAVEENADG